MSLEILGPELEAALASKETAQANWIARLLKVDSANPVTYDQAREALQTLEDNIFLAKVARERFIAARDNTEYVKPVRYVIAKPDNDQLLWRRKMAEIGSSMEDAIDNLPDSINLLAKLLSENEDFTEALIEVVHSMKCDAVSFTMSPEEGYI